MSLFFGLAQGYPKTGKTGALAALLNSGRWRVALLDFEGNEAPLVNFTKPEFRDRINIVRLRDKLAMVPGQAITWKGVPMAFANAFKSLDNFVGIDGNGKRADWGGTPEWGPETVLALDSTTAMGEADMRRILAMNTRTYKDRRIQDWGMVQAELYNFIDHAKSVLTNHFYCITHLKPLTPKLFEPEGVGPKGQVTGTPGVTTEMAETLNQAIVDASQVRLVPTIPGQNLAGSFAGMFGTALFFDRETNAAGTTSLVIRTAPHPAVDVAIAAEGLPKMLPISTGLLTIFEALNCDGGKFPNGKNVKK